MNQSDLDDFHHFASQELAHPSRALSLEDLVRQWNAQREQAETIASVRRGVADAEAGRVRDAGDVDAAIRAELGFPPRRR
jgi:predicted transcriptional regulator